MSYHLNAAQRAAKRQQQIAWLKERGLLADLPNAEDPPTEAQRALLTDTVADMIAVGLYSRTTGASVLRWGVRRLVSEARGEGVRFTTRGLS